MTIALHTALHAKAKESPGFRFYSLCDKVWRADVLNVAWQAVRRNGGAAGVDGQTVADIEAYGVERWLGERNTHPEDTMKLIALITLTAIALAGSGCGPAGTRSAAPSADAERRPMTMSEFRRWQRNWDRRVRDINEAQPADIAWGNEKRMASSQVIVLNPPLPKTVGSDTVQVEHFTSLYDERGSIVVWAWTASAMRAWEKSLREADLPLVITPRILGDGPGLGGFVAPHRRLHQEMLLAWDQPPFKGAATNGVLSAMLTAVQAGRLRNVTEREAAAKIIDQADESGEAWLRAVDTPRTKARIREVDERYRELVTQGAKRTKRVLESPQDPILLIDGKYLLMGSVVANTTDLFRMANWIIRTQLERNP